MTQQQRELIEKLSKRPDIEARIMELVRVVGESSGTFSSPDEVEGFLIREIDKLGHELIKSWAIDQEKVLTAEVANNKGTIKHSKKKFNGSLPSER